jgi:hypothetical protein
VRQGEGFCTMQGGMKQLELERDKDLFFPNRYMSPQVPSHYLSNRNHITPGKACATRDARVMVYPTDEMARRYQMYGCRTFCLGETCSDELLVSWLLQVQQILSDTCK